MTYLDQDGKITSTKRKYQQRSLFERPSKIGKLSRVSSTVTTHGSKFLTPTKKLDCLLSSKTIPQNREASPRPFAYIDLTEDPGVTYEQPSSTIPENETLVKEIQSENNERENLENNNEQQDSSINQQNQALLLEPIESEEDSASVVQDILLPPEELQILQEVDSPSQVVSEKKKPDERDRDEIELENEEQVEEEKEESLGSDRQTQDSQQNVVEEFLEESEQVKDSVQRDKEYEAELH